MHAITIHSLSLTVSLAPFLVPGELPPLSAFIPSGPAPASSGPHHAGMANQGTDSLIPDPSQPGFVEQALGKVGPGKEQAGDVIVETDDGREVEMKGPSTLARAKDVASNLASSAAAAVTQAGQSAVAAVQNLTDSSPKAAAPRPAQVCIVDGRWHARVRISWEMLTFVEQLGARGPWAAYPLPPLSCRGGACVGS